MAKPFTWDDTRFKATIKRYCDLKKRVDLKKELRRRAKNVGMRLIKFFAERGVDVREIEDKVKSLGYRVKVRSKILKLRGKRGGLISKKRMISLEIRARKNAKGFTSTGWFPAVEKLGGNPKDKKKRTGPRRGFLVERFSNINKSETLVNRQPGAAHTMDKLKTPVQAALDAEVEDMMKYIHRKLQEAAALP